MTVLKYNGTIWDTIGIRGFTAPAVNSNIMLDHQNRAYLAVNRQSPTNVGAFTIVAFPPPVLPVRLLNFEARATADIVHLSWSTASEMNNKYFTVERSQVQ